MPSLRIIEKTKAQWGLSDAVPGVLRTAGAEYASEQGAGRIDAGCDRAQSIEPWPGASVGVRRPEAWETRLSASEIAVGLTSGVIG
jgi:hypothetical protein